MKIRRPSSHLDAQALLDYGDRIVDGDTTPPTSDLESTFLRVQRAMRADQPVPGAMPDHLRMRAWEDIMQNTSAIPAGTAAGRPGNRRHSRSFPTVPLPRMAWTGAANIALALLVVIAGFGAWRAFDIGIGGSGNGPSSSGGRYAQAPMTPVPMATAEEEVTGCDFSESVPLYQGIDSAPKEDTALYITSGGSLMLHCAGEPEDTILAANVQYPLPPYGIPNVVQLHVGTGDDATVLYLNVFTGEQMEVNMDGFTSYLGHMNQSQRFQIAPAPDDPFTWGVYDVETMTSVSLAELTGAAFPTNGTMVVSVPEGGTAMAFAMGSYRTEGSANIAGDKGGAGDIVVVDEDLSTATWVTIPEDFPLVTNISVSDDGSHLAIVSNPYSVVDPENVNGSMISLLDVASGEEIVRTEPFTTPGGSFFTWVEDGAAAVYASDSVVYRIAAENGAMPTVLYESETTLRYIDAFMRPNILLVQEDVIAGGHESRVVMIRTETGEVTPFEGNAWSIGTTPFIPFEFQLAPIVFESEDQGTDAWNIVDPRTGEAILSAESDLSTSATIEEADGTLTLQQVRITATDVPVSAILPGDGRILVIDLSSEEPVISEVMLPENLQADGYRLGTVSLAPDGSALIIETKLDDASRFWTRDLGNEEAEWVQLPDGVTVSYLHTVE